MFGAASQCRIDGAPLSWKASHIYHFVNQRIWELQISFSFMARFWSTGIASLSYTSDILVHATEIYIYIFKLLFLAEVLHKGRRKSLLVHQTECLLKLCRHTVVPTAWMWWKCSAFTCVLAAFHHSATYKFPALQYQFILHIIFLLIYTNVANQKNHT